MKIGNKERLSLTLDPIAHAEILLAIAPYTSRQKTLVLIEMIRMGLEASAKGHKPGMIPMTAMPAAALSYAPIPKPPQRADEPRPVPVEAPKVAAVKSAPVAPVVVPEVVAATPAIPAAEKPAVVIGGKDFDAVKSFLDM